MHREEVIQALATKLRGALVALDFDGTLAPIVRDPSASRPTAGAIDVLTTLAQAGAQLAVITGRDAATAVRLGGLETVPGVVVVGLYGAEHWHAGSLHTPEQPAVIDTLRAELPAALAQTDDDVWIEDKRLSLVVHARRAADPVGAIAAVRPAVTALANRLGLETHDGKGVLEVRLPGYDKGSVLRGLVEQFAPPAALFAGDDIGDLPAFVAAHELRAAGLPAYGVAIASDGGDVDVVNAADLRVDDPTQFVALLREIIQRSHQPS